MADTWFKQQKIKQRSSYLSVTPKASTSLFPLKKAFLSSSPSETKLIPPSEAKLLRETLSAGFIPDVLHKGLSEGKRIDQYLLELEQTKIAMASPLGRRNSRYGLRPSLLADNQDSSSSVWNVLTATEEKIVSDESDEDVVLEEPLDMPLSPAGRRFRGSFRIAEASGEKKIDAIGHLADFFLRKKREAAVRMFTTSQITRPGKNPQAGSSFKQDLHFINACTSATGKNAAVHGDQKLIVEARQLLAKEELYGVLYEIIKNEKKAKGIWPKTTSNVFKDWATKMYENKRLVTTLHQQANGWLLRFKLLNRAARALSSHSPDQKRKIVEFWTEYHNSAWDVGSEQPTLMSSNSQPSLRSFSGGVSGSLGGSFSNLFNRRLQDSAIQSFLPPLKDKCRMRYLRECHNADRTPLPLPFVIGETRKLDVSDHNLRDADIHILAEALSEVQEIELVNLGNNTMVSDRALSAFLRSLMRPQLAANLVEFSLSGCTRAGTQCLEAVVKLVHGAHHLRCLDLSHVRIGLKDTFPLCEAISMRKHLEHVNLSDTGLGNGTPQHNCLCIKTLLLGKVQSLDIGWNSFEPQLFSCLGECLASNTTLQKLCLSNTASSDVGGISPVSHFLEYLCVAKSLVRLDLCLNRLNFRSALVLEDSVQFHKNLKHIILDDNPLGVVGIRSALRALTYSTSKLSIVETNGCSSGEEPAVGDRNVFYATRLSGTYNLKLKNPYHRSLLRMLYKAIERFNIHPQEAMEIVSASPPFSHPNKDGNGIWQVPTIGDVCVKLNISRCLQVSCTDLKPDAFSQMIARYYSRTRFSPAPEKAIALFARWKELDGNIDLQIKFLEALAKDFVWSVPYVETLATSSSMCRSVCIQQLIPNMPSDSASSFLTQLLYPTVTDYIKGKSATRKMLYFNADNPSGRYKLLLQNPADNIVAEQLIILDKWEIIIDVKNQRFDVSSLGNGSHARNVTYQGRPLASATKPFAEFQLPDMDMLELDYMSAQSAPQGSMVMGETEFADVLQSVCQAECDQASKCDVLRSLSHLIYIDSMQMRQMLCYFSDVAHQRELYVIFFNRLVDWHNSKLFRVCFDKHEDMAHLYTRTGLARGFPFLQPENACFCFDFSKYDNRVALTILLGLANRENIDNIRHPEYILPDGTEEPLKMGVPRSWELLDRIPTSGTFRCGYNCAPEHRSFAHRKTIARTFGYIEVNVAESDVTWVTGLGDAPADLIPFVVYMKSICDTLERAFIMLVGGDGHGVLTLREFEAGLDGLGCALFKGPNGFQRLSTIFRYLDPGGEGSVSKDEWKVLNQTWQELARCTKELVAFLIRSFGSLENAWMEMDLDSSNFVSLNRWETVLSSKSYVGPSAVLFHIIDKNSNGAVTEDEFFSLENYCKDAGEAAILLNQSTRRFSSFMKIP